MSPRDWRIIFTLYSYHDPQDLLIPFFLYIRWSRQKPTKSNPMSFVPILAILAQLENVLGDSTVMFKPAKILEFFIHLKNLIKHVGGMVEAYIALAEEYGRVLRENAELKT